MMLILKEWTIINMYDWVSHVLVVSESREALVAHYENLLGERQRSVDPRDRSVVLVDCSEDEDNDLERQCKALGIDPFVLSAYYTIEKIERV